MKKKACAALAAVALLSSCTDISDAAVMTQQGVVLSGTFATTTVTPDTDAAPNLTLPADTVSIATRTSPKETDAPDEDEPTVTAPTGSGRVTVAFAGDVTQSDVFGEVSVNNGPDYALGDVAPIFSAADIAFVNLETSVSDRGESEKKEGYGFRTDPDRLEVFTRAGIDIVSLANNHVRDFGMDALCDTFDNLDKHGLDYVGAGKDLRTAERLLVYEINGLKIGFTACNSFIQNDTWFATDAQAGINCTETGESSTEAYLGRIKEYDAMCDVLFVSVHWGIEYFHGASDEQKAFAHQLCDNGADIILGHHPHVLEPIEYYNGKMIFYSLGNFLFYKMDDDAGHTAIFTVEVDKDGFVSGRMQPVDIQYCKSNLLKEGSDLYNEIIGLVNGMSDGCGVYVDENGGINTE